MEFKYLEKSWLSSMFGVHTMTLQWKQDNKLSGWHWNYKVTWLLKVIVVMETNLPFPLSIGFHGFPQFIALM